MHKFEEYFADRTNRTCFMDLGLGLGVENFGKKRIAFNNLRLNITTEES